jgi:clan AA aspartic protease (TIGR02281 family)
MTQELMIEKRKIIVFATIEGISNVLSFKFILDTGATKTVIDEEVARKIGFDLFRLQKGDRLMTAGGALHSKILKLPKFSLFGKEMVDFEVNVIKFPMQITLLADGVIGMDFLLQFQNIKFNFDAKTIET